MTTAAPGRPRKLRAVRSGDGTAGEIADAAAELFSTQGFAATSMTQIAAAVGVAQNSIYYHFGSKLGLLNALLLDGVRPGLRIAEALEAGRDTSDVGVAARLYALALADGTVMAHWRWNLGALLLLPEARGAEMAEFHQQRQALRGHYVNMSRAVTAATGGEDIDDQVLRLVVTIINQRADGQLTPEAPRQLARSGMRICGWSQSLVDVEAQARRLLRNLSDRNIFTVPDIVWSF